ncbi:MAG: hypothetical protein ACKVOJ_14415 [Sphingomonadaceae bacterium]
MDATGTFDHGDAALDRTDGAIEAPANVGTDERRMHVRAYNYWVSLLSGRAYPSIEDLDPENIDDFGPHSLLLDFTSGIENPTIVFLGNALRHECDLPVGIASVLDIPRSSLLSRLTDHYLQIIANRAPIGFEAEFVNDRGNNTMYRGILMPFSSDDDTIDFIYGVINWKEVADDDTTAAIVDEVERALLAAPKRTAVTSPIWADGPSSSEPEPIAACDDEDEAPAFEPDGTEALGDWLAAARVSAEAAVQSDQRSRAALYRALSLAYDFALAADAQPQDYQELLADSGIVAQDRAPMTPIVKLVFGIGYDKTRLAEYGLVLMHGRRLHLGRGELSGFLERHVGGLKGVVQAERVERRPAAKAAPAKDYRERARKIEPMMIVPHEGDDEFVVMVARRLDAGHVAVLGAAEHDDAMLQKALRGLAR